MLVLSKEPKDQLQEIEAALKVTKSWLANFEAQVAKYHGPFWGEKVDSSGLSSLENHYFQYLSYLVPECVFSNPRVKATTKKIGEGEPDAEATELGLNRSIRDANLRKLLVKLCVDQGFCGGIALTTQEPERSGVDLDDPPFRPQSRRVPQKQYFSDPLAYDEDSERYRGHAYVADLEDLKERAREHPEEGWIAEALETLATGTEGEVLARDKDYARGVLDRKEVVLYEMWVPEHTYKAEADEDQDDFTPANGYHGVIYTIAKGRTAAGETDAKWVRKPRPYYGPRWGPYTNFGSYIVPNSSKPLGALTAAEMAIREHNAHAAAISKSSGRYKRLIIVDETAPDLAQRIKDDPDALVIPVPGFNRDRALEMEFGGTTQVEVAQNQIMYDRVERMLGMNDALRGAVTGVGTATENQLAAQSSNARIGFIRQQFSDSVLQLLKTWAWYLHEDDRVIFHLGAEAAKKLGEPGPYIFFGGHPSPERTKRIKAFFKREYPDAPTPPDELLDAHRTSFDNIELEIELYSMERTNEVLQQQRAMTAFEAVQAAAQGAITLPNANWQKLLNLVGDALNMPDLGELIDPKISEELAAVALQTQVQSASTQGESSQPRQQNRLARDVMPTGGFGMGGAGRVNGPPSAEGRIASMVPQAMPGRTLGGGGGALGGVPTAGTNGKPASKKPSSK